MKVARPVLRGPRHGDVPGLPAKRQALKAGIGFTELSNGFASCTDPTALQAICDRLGPGVIRVFAERWWSMLPLPLTEHDRAGGYWWELSMRQIETSCRRPRETAQ